MKVAELLAPDTHAIPYFVFDPTLRLYLPLWKRDGNTLPSDDACGHQATVTGAVWTPLGRQFDGSDDLISVANAVRLSSSDQLTIMVWCKSDSLGNWRDLVGKGTTDANKEYGLAVGATQIWFSVGDVTGPYWQANHGMSANRWHCIIATHNRVAGSSTLKVYRDGVDLGGTTSGPTVAPNNLNGLNLLVGDGINAPGNWNGVLGEVAIWGRCLASPERWQIDEATRWRYQ